MMLSLLLLFVVYILGWIAGSATMYLHNAARQEQKNLAVQKTKVEDLYPKK